MPVVKTKRTMASKIRNIGLVVVNYPDLQKSELLASTTTALVMMLHNATSYTMSTSVWFGLFHPYHSE